MQKTLFIKLALIGGLILLMMIPIGLIEDVVRERASYRDSARLDIERSWTGSQGVIGPLLVVPYRETVEREVWDEKAQLNRPVTRHYERRLVLLPEALHVDGDIATEERRRGLYKVPVYTADLRLGGHFSNRRLRETEARAEGRIEWDAPYLSVLIRDLRGVIKQPRLRWGEEVLGFESGARLNEAGAGMHAPLPEWTSAEEVELSFGFDFLLRGMESLAFAPVGRDTQVKVASAWPHPSFVGRFLPSAHQVSEQGFEAEWLASSFSSGMADLAKQCADGHCGQLLHNTFGLSLIQPVDIYQQAERSLKYGILFLVLTFFAFFLYEILKRLALHPVQYLLVGLAQSIFFLLLVSLSEHVAFALAYSLAAAACSMLLGFYAGGILASRRSGTTFGAAIAALYLVLYLILQSEDNALLMGSLLLFGILAAAMLATRNVDWYGVKADGKASAEASATAKKDS
jgi:inner membrane protein